MSWILVAALVWLALAAAAAVLIGLAIHVADREAAETTAHGAGNGVDPVLDDLPNFAVDEPASGTPAPPAAEPAEGPAGPQEVAVQPPRHHPRGPGQPGRAVGGCVPPTERQPSHRESGLA